MSCLIIAVVLIKEGLIMNWGRLLGLVIVTGSVCLMLWAMAEAAIWIGALG